MGVHTVPQSAADLPYKMYKLEGEPRKHSQSLLDIQEGWRSSEPDMFILTEDGNKVYTQNIILCIHSKMLREIMREERNSGIVGVSVPVRSCYAVLNFLKVLTEGVAFSFDSKELEEVTNVASVLGIELGRMQIGSRKGQSKPEYSEHKIDSEQSVVNVGEEMVECVIDTDTEIKLEKEENELNEPVSVETRMQLVGEKGIENDTTCNICGKTLNSTNALERHHEKRHSFQSKTKSPQPQIHGQYSCNECDKSFTWKYTLNRHMRTHTGENLLSCEVCEKKVRDKYQLTQHLLTHSDVSPFQCHCGKTFTTRCSLLRHEQRKHGNEAED